MTFARAVKTQEMGEHRSVLAGLLACALSASAGAQTGESASDKADEERNTSAAQEGSTEVEDADAIAAESEDADAAAEREATDEAASSSGDQEATVDDDADTEEAAAADLEEAAEEDTAAADEQDAEDAEDEVDPGDAMAPSRDIELEVRVALGDDEPKTRALEVGALVGGVLRPSGVERVQYQPGYFVGAFFRPRLASWLSVTAYFRREWIPVSVQAGGLDTERGSFPDDLEQPDIEAASLGLLAEPTWAFHPRLRAFAIVGAGWTTLTAPAPRWEGFDLVADRAGVEADLVLGAGAAFDIVPDWLVGQMRITHGFVLDQFGRAFEELQGVRNGRIVYFDALPRPESVTAFTFSLGVIL